LIENCKSRFIATDEKIHKFPWDPKKEIVKDNHLYAKRINAKIGSLKPSSVGKTFPNSGDFLV
jgi:hypothetical protein